MDRISRNRYSVEKQTQSNQVIPMTQESEFKGDPHMEIYVNANFRPHTEESVCNLCLYLIIKLMQFYILLTF